MNKLNLLAASALLAVAGEASALTVSTPDGSVTWDPNYVNLSEIDWIGQFDFTQFYSTSSLAEGADPVLAGAVGINTVLGSLTGDSSASGYFLSGVGEIYRINEANPVSCTTPSCELTFSFGGIGLNNDQTFDITNAWAKIYINDLTPNFSNTSINQAQVDAVNEGSLFLDLEFSSLAFTSGTVENGVVSATFNIIGGAAQPYFDPQTLTYTADAQFNTTTNAAYSNGGNGSIYGNTQDLPEPTTIALLGLGLLGLARSKREI
ncbi:PEP-CTERM sorting domain-containing protein [Methylomonas sp. HYX-M1]|uniref:PEP-CTERM sorting domain-containing protein n=1 Tax=Methylomonas sp. HYX-M1 TaxID=3139307 RepID=UPI00345B5176